CPHRSSSKGRAVGGVVARTRRGRVCPTPYARVGGVRGGSAGEHRAGAGARAQGHGGTRARRLSHARGRAGQRLRTGRVPSLTGGPETAEWTLFHGAGRVCADRRAFAARLRGFCPGRSGCLGSVFGPRRVAEPTLTARLHGAPGPEPLY